MTCPGYNSSEKVVVSTNNSATCNTSITHANDTVDADVTHASGDVIHEYVPVNLNDSTGTASNATDEETDSDMETIPHHDTNTHNNTSKESTTSHTSRFMKRNETILHCSTVRDLDVSKLMVAAVATDRGIQLLIPRFLCANRVRNAIYRQLLLPLPGMELIEFLIPTQAYSFTNISSYNNIFYRNVKWAPNNVLIAALTNDSQLVVYKVDLWKSSAESFFYFNVSVKLVENCGPFHSYRSIIDATVAARKISVVGQVTHFTWLISLNSSFDDVQRDSVNDLVFITRTRKLLIGSFGVEELDLNLKSVVEVDCSPSVIVASKMNGGGTQIVLGATNGSVVLFKLSHDYKLLHTIFLTAEVDLIPVSCATFITGSHFICVSKFNTVQFFSTAPNEQASAALESATSFDLPEDYIISKLEYRLDTLLWFSDCGHCGAIKLHPEQLQDSSQLAEAMKTLLWHEKVVIESKTSTCSMGAKTVQTVGAMHLSNNFEYLFYVYEEDFLNNPRSKRFHQFVTASLENTRSHRTNIQPLICINSDRMFNEMWHANTLFMDSYYFSKKYWPNKVDMISEKNGIKFSAESITTACKFCSKNIVSVTHDLIGFCSEHHDWPICCQGHIVEKPRDLFVCLMCKTPYCKTHAQQKCEFCWFPFG